MASGLIMALFDAFKRRALTLVLSVTGVRYFIANVFGDAAFFGVPIDTATDYLSFLVVLISAGYALFQFATDTPEDKRQRNIDEALTMIAGADREITDEGKLRILRTLREEGISKEVAGDVEEAINDVQSKRNERN